MTATIPQAPGDADLKKTTGYRCSACDAQHGQRHAAGCPETSLSRAATIAADILAELDSTKLPLAVPAAIGVLRTAVDAAANQVHPDLALPSRSNVVADTRCYGNPALPLSIKLQSLNKGSRWAATSNKSEKMFIGPATPYRALAAALAASGFETTAAPADSEVLRALRGDIPLQEPVYIGKALRAGREARVVLASGTGPVAAVHLVNIGLTGWVYTKDTAEAYAKGYNDALKHYRHALLEVATSTAAEGGPA